MSDMTVADDETARYSSELDEWDLDAWASQPQCLRAAAADYASAVSEALRPVVPVAIRLGAGKVPGADPEEDATWTAVTALARREVLASQRAGRDRGLAAPSLRLLDRIDRLACIRTDPAWQQSARERVGELVDARRQGRERGRRLREQPSESKAFSEAPSGGWFLRHPDDYWLRYALAADLDEDCRRPIEDLEAELRPAYQRLRDLDWTSSESASEVVCTVEIRTSTAGASKAPEKALVSEPVVGDVRKDQVVALAMVEQQDQPFNGKLMSVIVGDRWRVCAKRSNDDILVPLDGSRRLSSALNGSPSPTQYARGRSAAGRTMASHDWSPTRHRRRGFRVPREATAPVDAPGGGS
jgi:hypothetical protein